MRPPRLIIALAFAAVSWAQTISPTPSITAVADATVSVPPDVARVDIGVVTQGATAQEATTANAMLATAVVSALQPLVGSAANIQTISYTVSPVYNNPPPGQTATIIGYTVTNMVRATLTDLTQIGKVIDTALQSGANRIQGISFDLQDRTLPMAQALKMAAAKAKAQADAIAAGLNVHTGAVLHASQGVNTVNPVVFGIAAPAPTTPIETGLVVVRASVTLEVAIAP